jgi:N6-adenosine-specific RNA methylase IME4
MSNGLIQPGPTLLPGEPRYESLAAEFSSPEFASLIAGRLGLDYPFKLIHPFANLLPMMPEEDRLTLRESIAVRQNHPVLFHRGMLADGRNRARELIVLRKPISSVVFEGTPEQLFKFLDDENFKRRHLTFEQKLDYASRVARMPRGTNQHTKDSSRELPSLPLGEKPDQAEPNEPMMTQAEAAEKHDVSVASIKRYNTVLDKGVPELQHAVRQSDVTVNEAVTIAQLPADQQKTIIDNLPRDEAGKLTPEAKKALAPVIKEVRAEKQIEKKKKRDAKEAQLGARIRALPDIKAGLILSDFEWHFRVRNADTGMDRHAANHYVTAKETSTPEQIVDRQRERMSIAADDCIHLMWCPASFNAIALKVMELQGFTYVSQFAWIKPGIGTGFWVRDRHELLLIGVKGKIPCPAMGDQFDSAIEAPKGEHSEKPDFQYEIAEHYFPSLPKVELNARRSREGWIPWGNEAPEPAQHTLGIDSEEVAA